MGSSVKCLLVDDLEENLLALSALLRRADVELLKAHSGAEALELLLVNDVALALLDVQMPDMDGFELAELMRGSERTKHVPIIFVTAGARDQHRMFKGYESGAVDFLYKPIDPVILKNKANVFFQLHIQKQQLAEQLRARTETLRLNEMFTAVLSHDLRNPLNAIIMMGQLVEHRAEDKATKDLGARILSNGRRMGQLIDDVLDLTRTRLGAGISIKREKADLSDVVNRIADEQRITHPDRRIEITQEGTSTGEWDVARLAQVASNMIGNALQHGDASTAVLARIDGTHPDVVVFRVTNAGSIRHELLPHIFDPFRGGERQQGKHEGLGLGLYIVREIVQAHQGRVEVTSDDKYTTFTATVPRHV